MGTGVDMETKKLYLESIEAAYEDEFSAKVLAIEENKIVLDQTLFYPLGGGQNWDLGTLEGPNGTLDVVEVRGRDSIYHTVEDIFELDVGDEVHGKIDFGGANKSRWNGCCDFKNRGSECTGAVVGRKQLSISS